MRFKTSILVFLGIVCLPLSIYIASFDDWSSTYITVGTIVLIIGAGLIILGSPKLYNMAGLSSVLVPNPEQISLDRLFMLFKGMDSTLGAAWMGKMKMRRAPCLIFGPAPDGTYIYVTQFLGNFIITPSTMVSFLVPPSEEAWRLDIKKEKLDLFSDKQAVCASLMYQSMVDDVALSIRNYMEKGQITPLPSEKNIGKLYRFDENFKLLGQKFTFADFENNPIYTVEATIPVRTFYVREHSGEGNQQNPEIYRMTKRIFSLFFVKYDFYYKGTEYGLFRKRLNFFKDVFTMQTADGLLEMHSLNDRFGTNYIVSIDNVVIGSIAEHLAITFRNVVFDNFVLHVRDEKYTALIAGLGAMVAREMSRDRTAKRVDAINNSNNEDENK